MSGERRRLASTIAIDLVQAARAGRPLILAIQPEPDITVDQAYVLVVNAMLLPTVRRIGVAQPTALREVEPDPHIPAPEWDRTGRPPRGPRADHPEALT